MAEDGVRMSSFMRKCLDQYKSLRGKPKDSSGRPFWDVVVITTADEDQQRAFQLQIDDKLDRQELPLDLPIHVVTDPPGTRIGNGGSTLTSMEFLNDKYGEKMYEQKVLLIHAGGWSQRMPSATVLGKVFSGLPYGEPVYQMLDLKLAMYWPLVDKISPGVLLVCADDFMVYDLGPDSDWSVPEKGFTALAHPSPIEIGRTHGVYVFNDDEESRRKHVAIVECLEVLQKPNDERMEKRGAIIGNGEPLKFADGIVLNGKVVYTDSCFYFGTDIMKSLLELKKSIGQVTCEIDAYGDFLQSLGPRATSDYITLTGNISTMTSDLLDTRLKVFKHLKGSAIHLLVLNASKFIHIGTTSEYIHHLCDDQVFQQEMSFMKDVFNAWTEEDNSHKKPKLEDSSQGCVIHSSLPKSSSTHFRSVTEYCQFEIPVSIDSNSIISNCQYLQSAEQDLKSISFPDDVFLHSVPVTVGKKTQFVTVFLDISDNVKKSVSTADLPSLSFLGKTVQEFCSTVNLDLKDVIPKNSSGEPAAKLNLWTLKLFPVDSSMTNSLQRSLKEIQGLRNGESVPSIDKADYRRLSMSDLLAVKDVAAMLKYRRNLFQTISNALHSKE